MCACGARPAPPYEPGPIDFAYGMDGAAHRLAELRGRPLVLVLVRIDELTSELYVDQLITAFGLAAGNTRFLVLTIAPNEEPFLAEYVAERQLPFPIGLAEWAVAEGSSDLGLVPIVPTTYLLDESGAVAEIVVGAVTGPELARAISRRGW